MTWGGTQERRLIGGATLAAVFAASLASCRSSSTGQSGNPTTSTASPHRVVAESLTGSTCTFNIATSAFTGQLASASEIEHPVR